MSIFHRVLDRFADMLRTDRKVTYRTVINARIAPYVAPLLDRIVADDEDGDTLRHALLPWKRSQRPTIAVYQGDLSFCRIDGPWQMAGSRSLPLGGLILSPGVTAHLNPFEAQALRKRMEQAIEDTILAWVREHDLYALRRVPEEIDRTVADPAAKAIIAQWVFAERGTGASDQPETYGFGEPRPALCALCRKGLGHG